MKMDLALHNLQMLIYHKTQPTNQLKNIFTDFRNSYIQENTKLENAKSWFGFFV